MSSKDKKKSKKINGDGDMAVSKACVPCLKGRIAEKFKANIEASNIDIEEIKKGKDLFKKLCEERQKKDKDE